MLTQLRSALAERIVRVLDPKQRGSGQTANQAEVISVDLMGIYLILLDLLQVV